jgi:hypothetical protein
MLTGSELLAKVKELGEMSKSDLVRSAGYVSTKMDGSERLNFTAFYEALLEAKGVNFPGRGGHRSDGIRDAATSVQNRIVLIGRWLGRDAKLRVVLAEAVDPVALFIGSLHSS